MNWIDGLIVFVIYAVIAAGIMTSHRFYVKRTRGYKDDAIRTDAACIVLVLLGWALFPVYLFLLLRGDLLQADDYEVEDFSPTVPNMGWE